jgi:hypothetical protein
MASKRARNIVKTLDEQGHLNYGNTLPSHVVESLLECKYDQHSWEWIGKFLELKLAIEELGFFCTNRGQNRGNLRILTIDEMPKRIDSMIDTLILRQKRAINTMKNANVELQERHIMDQHYNAIHRLSMMLNSSKSALSSIDY